jgi:metal-responsive CopG/Arc/MetJ family transcriptional regulator
MRLMKVAISLPDPLFDAAERLAEQLKMPRSRLYAQALSAYLGASGGLAVTHKLNAIYATEASKLDPHLAAAQQQTLADEAW